MPTPTAAAKPLLRRPSVLVTLLAVAVVAAACGPMVVINNKTTIPVRVFIISSAGEEAFAPSPGEYSTADVSTGSYHASVVPDDEWIAYAKQTRAFLGQQLANSDSLSGPQLLDVIQRLKDIAQKIAAMQAAAGSAASCSGSASSDNGIVDVTQDTTGALAISCH